MRCMREASEGRGLDLVERVIAHIEQEVAADLQLKAIARRSR